MIPFRRTATGKVKADGSPDARRRPYHFGPPRLHTIDTSALPIIPLSMPLFPVFPSPLITGLVLPGWVLGLFLGFFRSLPPGELTTAVIWAMGSALFLVAAAWLNALTVSGMLGAWAMGMLIFLAGGWAWIWPMIAFFILSSALTRIKHRSNRLPDTGGRNLVQVFANGGIPLLVAAAYGLWPIDGLYLIFLAALAGSTADTWGTEIGSWSRRQPRDIVTWQVVEPGTSGGVTFLGTTGSLLGAAALGGVGYGLQPERIGLHGWLAITLIGFLAALVDSLLGATLQARYRTVATGEISEHRPPADQRAVVHRGWGWLDNNGVNLACSLSGAALGWLWLIG